MADRQDEGGGFACPGEGGTGTRDSDVPACSTSPHPSWMSSLPVSTLSQLVSPLQQFLVLEEGVNNWVFEGMKVEGIE